MSEIKNSKEEVIYFNYPYRIVKLSLVKLEETCLYLEKHVFNPYDTSPDWEELFEVETNEKDLEKDTQDMIDKICRRDDLMRLSISMRDYEKYKHENERYY